MAGQIADMQSAGELRVSYGGHSIDTATKVNQYMKKEEELKCVHRCHRQLIKNKLIL